MAVNAVEQGAGIYYTGTYWNDYEAVQERIHERLSGDPHVGWLAHFFNSTGRRTFRHALILNSGNGHVERDLLRLGIVERATGVEYAQDLLNEAREMAAAEQLPLSYHRMDTNAAEFPSGPFDLVVNSAAAHHIARLDRVFRRLCELLPPDGWFISFDYVGPHRNQYSWEQWSAADGVNRLLPVSLRQTMNYPHLPTMLATDPTEGIHSELILETLDRYFHVREVRPLGGAIAYLLLTHNDALAASPPEERDPWIRMIIDEDDAHLERFPDSSMFVYAAAQPNHDQLADSARLERWAQEEDRREAVAAEAGGRYHDLSLLQRMQLQASELATAKSHLTAELQSLTHKIAALQRALDCANEENARLRATFPVLQWDRLRRTRLLKLKQRSPMLTSCWERLRTMLDRLAA